MESFPLHGRRRTRVGGISRIVFSPIIHSTGAFILQIHHRCILTVACTLSCLHMGGAGSLLVFHRDQTGNVFFLETRRSPLLFECSVSPYLPQALGCGNKCCFSFILRTVSSLTCSLRFTACEMLPEALRVVPFCCQGGRCSTLTLSTCGPPLPCSSLPFPPHTTLPLCSTPGASHAAFQAAPAAIK